jgi:Xaa-Pro aminopeptidase
VVASDLAALARREYARVGLEFRWGLVGHGIGLVIHEEPQLLLDVHDPIVEGMTMEIELGYFGDTGGYHIEDLVHVTANGAVNLTKLEPERKLIESVPSHVEQTSERGDGRSTSIRLPCSESGVEAIDCGHGR